MNNSEPTTKGSTFDAPATDLSPEERSLIEHIEQQNDNAKQTKLPVSRLNLWFTLGIY